ncbi:MAG: hypothetical protein KGJ86_15090 [Chloroflexota bacterium]|nr:hypothetical protein [Chloroflexota bacterium]
MSNYDRTTVGLWARSHAALEHQQEPGRPLAEAAAHALLAKLRDCSGVQPLFARYDADPAGDFSLIGSILPHYPRPELLWRIRDAAFHLCWLELHGRAR